MQLDNFFGLRPLEPWGGAKRSNMIKFQLLSQFQIFLNLNFVCLLTNEIYKTYQTGFSFLRLGHAPGVGFGGTEGQKLFFSEIQPNLVCELLT